MAGVYLAERLNSFMGENWKSFAGQNYFDPQGVFLSVLWSGPLLVISIIILVNTLFSLCQLIVRWKRAELRHRARLSHNKEEWWMDLLSRVVAFLRRPCSSSSDIGISVGDFKQVGSDPGFLLVCMEFLLWFWLRLMDWLLTE